MGIGEVVRVYVGCYNRERGVMKGKRYMVRFFIVLFIIKEDIWFWRIMEFFLFLLNFKIIKIVRNIVGFEKNLKCGYVYLI